MEEFATRKFKFLDEFGIMEKTSGREARSTIARRVADGIISRHPRLAISVPILIGLAVGAGVLE